MSSEDRVHITEMFPRDGLQTLVSGARLPSTDEKVEIIEALAQTGLSEIECTSFVQPRYVPTLADAEEVMKRVQQVSGVTYRALVPNLKGAQRAIDAGVGKLSCLIVASETYQRLNSRMSIDDNLREIEKIVELCRETGAEVDCGMGICFVCPYEGKVAEDGLMRVIGGVRDAGITELTIADSVGLATPRFVAERSRRVVERWPDIDLGLHLHTLAGMALANVYAAWEAGVRRFETATCGMGAGIAMPVAAEYMGNVATEDVVFMFDQLGVDTGVDLGRLHAVGQVVQRAMGVPPRSFTSHFGTLEEFYAAGQRYLDAHEG